MQPNRNFSLPTKASPTTHRRHLREAAGRSGGVFERVPDAESEFEFRYVDGWSGSGERMSGGSKPKGVVVPKRVSSLGWWRADALHGGGVKDVDRQPCGDAVRGAAEGDDAVQVADARSNNPYQLSSRGAQHLQHPEMEVDNQNRNRNQSTSRIATSQMSEYTTASMEKPQPNLTLNPKQTTKQTRIKNPLKNLSQHLNPTKRPAGAAGGGRIPQIQTRWNGRKRPVVIATKGGDESVAGAGLEEIVETEVKQQQPCKASMRDRASRFFEHFGSEFDGRDGGGCGGGESDEREEERASRRFFGFGLRQGGREVESLGGG